MKLPQVGIVGRLAGDAGDVLLAQEIGLGALGVAAERAETALRLADVGEIDVAVDVEVNAVAAQTPLGAGWKEAASRPAGIVAGRLDQYGHKM